MNLLKWAEILTAFLFFIFTVLSILIGCEAIYAWYQEDDRTIAKQAVYFLLITACIHLALFVSKAIDAQICTEFCKRLEGS